MPLTQNPRRRRLWRAGLAMGTTLGLAAATLATISPASAVVPKFPDNLVVFPDRDFVSVEGYADHRGETATVEVTRPGSGVIGSAMAVVSGADVAFQVNHPGGVCWGAGTSLEVTPDIKAGDVVSITFPGGTSQDTTVSTAAVSEDLTREGTTVTVQGTLGPDVDKTRIEQRIVDPDLVGVIGRRDVRAVPGPVVPSPRGGYSSGLTFPTTSTFVATYEFATRAAADTAAAADLGERTMSWQEEDADGNRQGLTIAEFGETGGPGFGDCPAGTTDQPSSAGSASVARSADRTSAVVSWTSVTSPPGADPVPATRSPPSARPTPPATGRWSAPGSAPAPPGPRWAGWTPRPTTRSRCGRWPATGSACRSGPPAPWTRPCRR